MKKKKKTNKFYIINSIILGIISIISILFIIKLDILPLKYLIPLILSLILIPLILIILMINKKIKKKIKKIISIISIIIIIILSLILFYMNKTYNFLNSLKNKGYIIENYSVIVLKNRYEEIEELNNKTIDYYNNENSNIEQALQELENKIKIKKEDETDNQKLIEKLLNEKTDAIVIEQSQKKILEENEPNFDDDTKVIYTIQIKVKQESSSKQVNVKKAPFNVYISGIDTYGSIESVSRSDVNIVASINPSTHQILLTTIPRDYYVELSDTDGEYDKLTHAGIYGTETSIKTIENLLDIDINYYVKVNFSSVENIVNALNGVDVYSEYSFIGYEGTVFNEGYNTVNGFQALDFARTRKTVPGGDRTRGQNQQALIHAILNKAMKKEIITKYTSILSSIEGTFETNMTTDEMTSIIKQQLKEMQKWNITSISLEGYDGYGYTYSYPWQELYVMMQDEDSIENAKQKIQAVKNGETLESSYIENDGNTYTATQTTRPEEDYYVPYYEEPETTYEEEIIEEQTYEKEEPEIYEEEKEEKAETEEIDETQKNKNNKSENEEDNEINEQDEKLEEEQNEDSE